MKPKKVAQPNLKAKQVQKGKPKKKGKGKKKADKAIPLTEMETFILINAGKLALNKPSTRAKAAKELTDKAFELVEADTFMKKQLELADKFFKGLSIEKKAICLFLIAHGPKVRRTFWKLR